MSEPPSGRRYDRTVTDESERAPSTSRMSSFIDNFKPTSGQWTTVAQTLAYTTAVFAVLTITFAVGWSGSRAEPEALPRVVASPDVREQLENLQSENASLQDQVAGLREDKAELTGTITGLEAAALAGAVGAGPTASEPPAPIATAEAPAPPPGHAARRSGQLTLTDGSATVDFDSPPNDPQWGRLNGGSGFGDLYNDEETFFSVWSSGGMAKLSIPADYTSCSQATYADTEAFYFDVAVNDQFCVLSSEGRFVALSVVSVEQPSTITFDVTVYE